MKAINFVLSVFFFAIGVFALLTLLVTGIAVALLVALNQEHLDKYPVAGTTLLGLVIPTVFIGVLAFYSLEMSASLFDKSRKILTAH